MSFKKVDPKMNFPKMEEEILKFWEENKIFEKSIENREGKPLYSFYDGPPFATGTPHYGHIVASTIKDVVPRFWTMKGYKIERKWGWDCHGLPIENIVEKEMGSKAKKDIEALGVEKFNSLCKSKVLKYVEEWKVIIKRMGRWADMENPYKTMDLTFMESVWWVFKKLWDEGLIYEGYRSMHICPRCETTLSQSEVAEGYKDVKDLSVIAKFELVDEPGSYILAWTTTPWTLIGNVALAVGEEIEYSKVVHDEKIYILAKEKIKDVFGDKKYKILEDFKGKTLIGRKYKPLFDYYANDEKLENRENGWKIYPGDFVSTEEGTGIVHIASAFGEDDMNLGKKYNLPFIQHIGISGVIEKKAVDFSGMNVKPQDDTQKTDIEIIKNLAHRGLLFSKEKYEHSYPHCWRCDTPLLNYTTSSWFVAVRKIKEKMLKTAEDINWIPDYIKEGRWGNWLENARDWSISRQRFWASVMPVWKCEKCHKIEVFGSVKELENVVNLGKFYIIRHGEAENNVEKVLCCRLDNGKHLTKKGIEDVNKITGELKKYKIDMIFSSDLNRTKETSEIIAKKLGVKIIYDKRLRETNFGSYEGMKISEVKGFKKKWDKGINMRFPNGDDWFSLSVRAKNFYEDIFNNYRDKKILIVSHGDFLTALEAKISGKDYIKEVQKIHEERYIKKGEYREMRYKISDLHKHTVDKITFECGKCDGEMKRIPDVLDTWFDSGSMPYAQAHYPFENEDKFEKSFPAQFIAEGIDQTRAWFYYLHVIAAGIKKTKAFDDVIVNGIVLAEDGKKMSKKLQNYPDPKDIFDKHGADAMRQYLLASPVMLAENLNFKEGDIANITRGMLRMLWNSYSFFVLYANIDGWEKPENNKKSDNLLDRWIVSELNTLIKKTNEAMEEYNLPKAVRNLPLFIDNLSNWYIRRSRKRFWKSENDNDKNQAYETLHHVLIELSKVMAPFTPFIAEEIYKNLSHPSSNSSPQAGEENVFSVHLADFPETNESLIDEKLNEDMKKVRELISEGLQLRAQNKIKVRQPLSAASIKYQTENKELIDIMKEELNVKEIEVNEKQEKDVDLNTEITPELKLEGQAREVIRYIQEMRKEAGYEVDNRIRVCYSPESEVFEKFGDLIAREVLAEEIKEGKMDEADLEREIDLEGEKFSIYIKR